MSAKWLYYCISSYDLKKLNEATGVPSISRSYLYRIKFYTPEYKQQQKIATILTTVDQLIEKTQTLIDKYTTIKQGMMADLFTRGIDLTPGPDGRPESNPNYGQLRPPREQAPELYKETELGWVPKEWEVNLLGDVAEVIDPQPDHRTPPESENGVPYVGVGDFYWNQKIDKTKCRKVIAAAYEKQRSRFQVDLGDIIFGKIGTIGQPKRMQETEGFALSANILLIKGEIYNGFIYYFFHSDVFSRQLSNIINVTSQPALGIQTMREIKLAVPTCSSELSFLESRLVGLEESVRLDRELLSKYQEMKKGLMQDLLTGKIQVQV